MSLKTPYMISHGLPQTVARIRLLLPRLQLMYSENATPELQLTESYFCRADASDTVPLNQGRLRNRDTRHSTQCEHPSQIQSDLTDPAASDTGDCKFALAAVIYNF